MATATLVTTVGSASANSYATLVEAEQFHDNRPLFGTTWSAAVDDLKNKALLWATKLLDSLVDWEGTVVDDVQALDWPRNGLVYPTGYFVSNSIVPSEIKDATAEYARQLIAEDRSADSDVETQGLTSLKVGPIALVFKDSVIAKVVPDAIVTLLPEGWYMQIRGRERGVINLVRV